MLKKGLQRDQAETPTLLTASEPDCTFADMKRVIASLVIGLGGVALFTYELLEVLKIGTCASGNTAFLIANRCPNGTGTKILLLAAGITLAAIGIIVGIGRTSLLIWSALFLAAGVATLLASLTGSATGAAKSTGYILGAVFIPMGLVPMLWLISNGVGGLREKRRRARSKQASATVTRVEELQRYGFNQVKVRITYAVAPLDDASFEVSRETNTLASQMPHTGQKVTISYDPGNHEKFELVSPPLSFAGFGPGGAPAEALTESARRAH